MGADKPDAVSGKVANQQEDELNNSCEFISPEDEKDAVSGQSGLYTVPAR